MPSHATSSSTFPRTAIRCATPQFSAVNVSSTVSSKGAGWADIAAAGEVPEGSGRATSLVPAPDRLTATSPCTAWESRMSNAAGAMLPSSESSSSPEQSPPPSSRTMENGPSVVPQIGARQTPESATHRAGQTTTDVGACSTAAHGPASSV